MHEEVIRVRLEPDEKKVVEAARNLRATGSGGTGGGAPAGGGRTSGGGGTGRTGGRQSPQDRADRDAERQANRERQRQQAEQASARRRADQERRTRDRADRDRSRRDARDAADRDRAVVEAIANPIGAVRGMAAARVRSFLTTSPAMRWIGRGVGGVGPAAGAVFGGAAVAGGVALGADMIRRAAGQFVEGVRNYVRATDRFAEGVLRADPARIVSAGNLARLAGAQVATLRNTVAGGAAGAGIGAVIGGAATGGPGAVIGGTVGGGIGTAAGYFSSRLLSWFTDLRSKVQEWIFSLLDGLVDAVRNYNGTVYGLAQQYELKQKLFLINLGQYTQGVAAAWLDFKSRVLEVVAGLMPRLQPVFDAIINYLNGLQDQIPGMVAGILDGAGSVIDGLILLRNGIQSFVGVLGVFAQQGVGIARMGGVVAMQGATVARLAVTSSASAVKTIRPAIVAAVSFITGIVRQGQSVANLALSSIRYAMNTILDIVRSVASFIPGLKLGPAPKAGGASPAPAGANATPPVPAKGSAYPPPTSTVGLPQKPKAQPSAPTTMAGSLSSLGNGTTPALPPTTSNPLANSAGPTMAKPPGDGLAGIATALHQTAQTIRDAAKQKTSGSALGDASTQLLKYLSNFAYASNLPQQSARGTSAAGLDAFLAGHTYRPRAAVSGPQKVLDAMRAGQLGASASGPQPTPAQSAAATQAKAPKSAPRFQNTYNMPIELRVSHEQQVHQAMMAVRDHLMQSIGTARNEARLSISMMDARMGMFGF